MNHAEIAERIRDNRQDIARAVRIEKVIRAYERHYMDQMWARWLVRHFPASFIPRETLYGSGAVEVVEFAEFHAEFWQWVQQVQPYIRPEAFLAIWFRFGGKSTNCEAACCYLGGEKIRRYGWYVCATQSQADDHVQTVGNMLTSTRYATAYPDMVERLLNKFNSSLGWRA